MIITGLIISIAVLIVAFLTLLFCIKTRRTRRNANRLRKLEESWNNNDPMSDQAAMLPVTTDLYNNNHTPPKVSSWRIRLLSRLPRRLRPSWIIDEELKQKMMARRLSPPMGDLGSRWDPHARWSGDGIICTKTDREGGGDKLSTNISFASLSMFENLAARTTTQGASSPLPSLPLAHTSDKSKRTSLSRISEQASIIGRPILRSQALAQSNARKSRSSLLMGVAGNPRPLECQARLSLSEEMIRSDMLQYMVFNDDVRLSIKSSSVGDVETAQRATRHPATTIFRNSEMDSPTLPTFRVETRSNSISEQGNSKGGGSTRPTSIFAPYAFPSSTVIDDKVKPGRSSAVERAIFNSRY
ncbi:hypothetical protein CPB86DRAFT_292421 [Serendipita vermifera]|nr:hypothetical protein CPB86DRAFT_292421 [Serendipita vermifera]